MYIKKYFNTVRIPQQNDRSIQVRLLLQKKVTNLNNEWSIRN